MEELRPQVLEDALDEEAKKFHKKMHWWQTAVKKLSKAGSRGMKWQTDALKAAFARDGASYIIWISPQSKVVPLTRFNREGGHGKVRKVRIEGMDIIPPHIAFAGKVLKAESLCASREARSIEALACSLNHPSIIKFFAIHARTMEAYTLWWNGGLLLQLKHLDEKVSQTIDWQDMKRVWKLPKEKQKEFTLFQRHKAKLAWALVYVIHLMHKSLLLHNDLLPMNIMLHYLDYSNEIINIGICDWGVSSHVHEKGLSWYGYQSEAELEKQRRGRWWVAPELFYTFGAEACATSLKTMQQKHTYTKKSDSYSIGKVTKWMKIGDMVEYDKDLFKSPDGSRYFAFKLSQLINPNLEKSSKKDKHASM